MTLRSVVLVSIALVFAASGISADPGAYDDVQTSIGPTFVHFNEIAAVGTTACLSDPTFPLACASSPGASQGFGPARFDVSSWGTTDTTREVHVWVETYDFSGFCAVRCSYSVLACSDYDDDRTCTEDDDVALTVSGEPFVGDGTTCETDNKVCGDPFSAATTLCVREDANGGYDEVVVHTGVYVEEFLFGPEGGAGLDFAMNFYDVHVEYGNWGCTPSAAGVPVLVSNQEMSASIK